MSVVDPVSGAVETEPRTSPGGRAGTELGVNKGANSVLGFIINKNKLLYTVQCLSPYPSPM